MTSYPIRKYLYVCGLSSFAALAACNNGRRSDAQANTIENTDAACPDSLGTDENDTLSGLDTDSDRSPDGVLGTDSNRAGSDRGTDSDTEERHEDSAPSSCFGPIIVDRNARACDLLLDVGRSPVDAVHLSTDTRGAVIQRPPRLAISIVTSEDAPFSEDAVCLEGEASHVTLTRVNCYDRLGVSLARESAVMP
jgi:hypothetical protein